MFGREPVFPRWYVQKQDTVDDTHVFHIRPTIISPNRTTVEQKKPDSFRTKEANIIMFGKKRLPAFAFLQSHAR